MNKHGPFKYEDTYHKLHFTQVTESVQRIPIRKRSVGPVVVEDDVSPMYGTRCVCTVWYCVSGIVGVLETQGSVIFIG